MCKKFDKQSLKQSSEQQAAMSNPQCQQKRYELLMSVQNKLNQIKQIKESNNENQKIGNKRQYHQMSNPE